MSKRVIYIVVPILLITCLGLVIQNASLDGFKGVALSLAFKDTSVYASNYSQEKYESIKIGTPRETVINTLGLPIEVDTWKNIERLHYSISPVGSHYRVRQIGVFQGKVVEKTHYYYID